MLQDVHYYHENYPFEDIPNINIFGISNNNEWIFDYVIYIMVVYLLYLSFKVHVLASFFDCDAILSINHIRKYVNFYRIF
jgi:hypothetical protein